MDPVTTAIVAALAAGVPQGKVADSYNDLKQLIKNDNDDVIEALEVIENFKKELNCEIGKKWLEEKVKNKQLDKNTDILDAAKKLMDETNKSLGIQKRTKAKSIGECIKIIVDLAVIVGIIVAIVSICNTNKLDKKQTAISAIKYRIKDQYFIKSLVRIATVSKALEVDKVNQTLKIIYQKDHESNLVQLTDDVYYILSTYDYISILYFNKLAEEKILMDGIYKEMRSLSKNFYYISKLVPSIKSKRKRFDKLLHQADWKNEKELRNKTTKNLK